MGRNDELHQGLVPVPSIFGKEQRTASDLIANLGEIAWLLTVDIEIHMMGKKAKKKKKTRQSTAPPIPGSWECSKAD